MSQRDGNHPGKLTHYSDFKVEDKMEFSQTMSSEKSDADMLDAVDKKVRWLIDRMQASREDRHIQRMQWERQLESFRSAARATPSERERE